MAQAQLPSFEREIGRRFVDNIDPGDMSPNARAQNWDILQDQRGMIYIANSAGVIEYDGVRWRIIPMDNYGVVLCLGLDEQNRLYLGGNGNMGYLEADSSGALVFRSLVPILPDSLQSFSFVVGLEIWKGDVYFRTLHQIFQIDLASHQLKKIWSSPTRIYLKKVVDDLYIWREGIDWGKVSGDSLISFDYPLEQYKRSPSFLPFSTDGDSSSDILIMPRQGKKFLFDGNRMEDFPLGKDVISYLDQYGLFESISLGGRRYVLASENGGSLIIDQEGQLLDLIDKGSGVENTLIYHAYMDSEQVLWLGSDYGISKMEAFSPFSFYGEEEQLKGGVQSMIRHQGKMFIGTSQGAFELIPSANGPGFPHFKPINGPVSCWSFHSDGDLLLLGGANQIFQLKHQQVESIAEGLNYPYDMYRSPFDSSLLYVGYSQGLAVLKKRGKSWRAVGKVSGIAGAVRSIIETKAGHLWLGTDVNGFFQVILSEKIRKQFDEGQADTQIPANIRQFREEAGVPNSFVNVATLANRTVFITTQGLKQFDEEKEVFVPERAFGDVMADSNLLIWRIVENLNGRITALTDYPQKQDTRNHGSFLIPEEGGGYRHELGNFDRLPVRMMSSLQFLYPDPLQADVLWMGGSSGLMRYDMSKEQALPTDFPVYLRAIKTSGDSMIYHGNVWPDTPPELSFDNNSLRFEYAAAFFQSEGETTYQIFLEGNDKDWSDWSKETYADYTNLPEGTYRFHVRARNVYFHISESEPFEFDILPPWYRSKWAYALYALIISLIMTMIAQLYSKWRVRQLEARNQELEETVAERTEEIQNALEQLKVTQNQLILQEKMASLGQLTMGIAHEIKNPLNSVKNFAEGADELLEEFEEDWEAYENSKDPKDRELLRETLTMLRKNNRFIIQNGDRANRIVNGMMNHANDNFAQKNEVDINQLVEEQIDLALHGFSSQENPLTITINKQLATDLPALYIHPQELGRILINLMKNAHDALKQKKSQTNTDFVPTIDIETTHTEDQIIIRIRDNGTGIPPAILSKIFQPFYSTKPTGEGNTGLGLSISYELVTQSLQGTLEVDSKEGEYTAFMIAIPVQKNQQA